jgi:hypothetical protein
MVGSTSSSNNLHEVAYDNNNRYRSMVWYMMSWENIIFIWKQLWYGLSMIFLCIRWFLVRAQMEN